MESEKIEEILEVQSTALLSCIGMLILVVSRAAQDDVMLRGPASKMINQAKTVQKLLALAHHKGEMNEGSVSNN